MYSVKYIGISDGEFGIKTNQHHLRPKTESSKRYRSRPTTGACPPSQTPVHPSQYIVHSQIRGRVLCGLRKAEPTEGPSTLPFGVALTEATTVPSRSSKPISSEPVKMRNKPNSRSNSRSIPQTICKLDIAPAKASTPRPSRSNSVTKRTKARNALANEVAVYRLQYRRHWFPGKERMMHRRQVQLEFAMSNLNLDLDLHGATA